MHGHEPLLQLPGWASLLGAVVLVYLLGAMAFGRPYCMLPDMKWPVTLVKAVAGGGR